MRNLPYKILTVLFLFSFISGIFGADIPVLKHRVTDQCHLLSPREQQVLEEKLYNFETQTSTQVAVLIIPTTGRMSIEQYSIQVVEKWQLGQKGKDNGVLLVISIDDKRVRIEVGYGLEGVLTDLISSSIIRNEIAPHFRTGNFYRGIDAGISSIFQASQNAYRASPARRNRSSHQTGSPIGSLIVFVIFIIFMLSGRKRRRGLLWFLVATNMFRSGGGSYGGGGGFGSFGGGGGGFGGGGASGGW